MASTTIASLPQVSSSILPENLSRRALPSRAKKVGTLAYRFFRFGLNIALFFSNPILWVFGATIGVIERPRIQIYSQRVSEFWDRNKVHYVRSCLFGIAAFVALAVVWPIAVIGYAAHTTSQL